MMSPKRIRLKAGDLVYVPLGEHLGIVGIILHVSRIFKSGILVGFYNKGFESLEDVNLQTLDKLLETPNYTDLRIVTSGHWVLFENSPELLAQAVIPKLRVAYDLYFRDEIVGKVEQHEFRDCTELGMAGGLVVENKLRLFFQTDSDESGTTEI